MCTDIPDSSAGCAPHARLALFLSPCSSSSCTDLDCQSIFSLKSYKK